MRRSLVLLLFIPALAACSGGADQAEPVEVTLEAKEFGFSPGTIEGTAGQPIHITFNNLGTVEHDFSIMEIPMAMPASPAGGEAEMAGHNMEHMEGEPELHVAARMGQTATLEFTPTKPGTYEFICTVPGHREAGMTGTLVVNAP